ncbi:MAG TPA: sugar ABC transporter permease, partial [Acidimicrobiia bacterium]|nr:sugar ABC transporter permease [Acidimicrobiia bacterium]
MAVATEPDEEARTKKVRGGNLLKQEQRLAYWLLLPTLLILILIAFYPLGSVFYASFTDRAFASAREPQFVGLQNYSELLSMKIRELP